MPVCAKRQTVLMVAGLALLAVSVPAAARVPQFEPGEKASVRAVLDGGTVTLSDGRSVVLVGIAVPRGRQPFADKAKSALEKMLVGREVELRYAGNRVDRHGRVLTQLFIGKRWVEGEMLNRGLARVESAADNRTGIADMLAREAKARRARRGLWRDGYYAVRRAEEAGRFAESFQLVEGRLIAVGHAEGAVFLNFAEDWHRGFSLRLAPETVRLFRAEGIDPAALTGKRVRVRGFIHGSERPTIDITHPEQIERQ